MEACNCVKTVLLQLVPCPPLKFLQYNDFRSHVLSQNLSGNDFEMISQYCNVSDPLTTSQSVSGTSSSVPDYAATKSLATTFRMDSAHNSVVEVIFPLITLLAVAFLFIIVLLVWKKTSKKPNGEVISFKKWCILAIGCRLRPLFRKADDTDPGTSGTYSSTSEIRGLTARNVENCQFKNDGTEKCEERKLEKITNSYNEKYNSEENDPKSEKVGASADKTCQESIIHFQDEHADGSVVITESEKTCDADALETIGVDNLHSRGKVGTSVDKTFQENIIDVHDEHADIQYIPESEKTCEADALETKGVDNLQSPNKLAESVADTPECGRIIGMRLEESFVHSEA